MAKFALLVPKIERGGVFAVKSRLAVELSKMGHEVSLISVLPFDEALFKPPNGVKYLSVGVTRVSSALIVLHRIFREAKFDAVIVSQIHLGIVSVISRFGTRGTRLVVVEHSSIVFWRNSNKFKDRFSLYLAKHLLRKAEIVVFVSRDAHQGWQQFLRRGKARLLHVPNPVLSGDEPVFSGQVQDHRSGLLYVGRLAQEKRVDLLLTAFSKCPNLKSETLTIAGDGPLMPELQQLSRDLGTDDRVKFLGSVDNVSELMQKCRLLVLCSEKEGLPTVLIEALSNGCEVISSDCQTGPREILNGGRFGHLFSVGDSETLASLLATGRPTSFEVEDLRIHLSQYLCRSSAEIYESLCISPMGEAGL